MQTRNPIDDTSTDVERILVAGIRKMTPAEKFRRVVALNELLDTLTLSLLREQYPDAGEAEYRMRLASRRLPADLMKKAFGWDVDIHGY